MDKTLFSIEMVDQLDLALEQLSLDDKNFSRFSLMLIDNVVELALHTYAVEFSLRNDEKDDLLNEALRRKFDKKVKFAKSQGLINSELATSINCLHDFRNTAYHSVIRFDDAINSLAIFYFKCACKLLKKHPFSSLCVSEDIKLSFRAKKYLTNTDFFSSDSFLKVWDDMEASISTIDNRFIDGLVSHTKNTILKVESDIGFLVDNAIYPISVSDVIEITSKKNEKINPFLSWESRYRKLASEKNEYKALIKYVNLHKDIEKMIDGLDEIVDSVAALEDQNFEAMRGN